MAKKHQIWSSNKKTRQRANRSWRRANKKKVESLSPVSVKRKKKVAELPQLLSRTVYETPGAKNFGGRLNLEVHGVCKTPVSD